MRIRELRIKNFRKIKALTVVLPPGLTVLVGANNAGKSTVMDSLRLMLFPSREFDALRLTEDDFRLQENKEPIEITYIFTDLTVSDEARFLECLVKIADGKFEMQVNVRVELNPQSHRANYKWWGGETEGGSLPNNFHDNITSVYLQPLRDPENGLRAGQSSQVARLVRRLTPSDKEAEFETIADKANDDIRKLASVTASCDVINAQIVELAGEKLAQKADLIFSDPSFSRIIGGLFPEIDELPFGLNGLGYNNLVFTATTLGALRKHSAFSHRSVLIEEPEAHLHPQLQVLLLSHLNKVSQEKGPSEVQVIASSHSPILASQASVDSVVCLHEDGIGNMSAVSICTLPIDPITKKKLQRFLDATRGELFFARSIIMVEGIAEVLLLPVLAKAAKGDLKKSGITVLNADGINFDAFLPLFGDAALKIPSVILTDGDADAIGGPISATAQGLKGHEDTIPNLRIRMSGRTFEHELARKAALLPHMLKAYEVLHPTLATALEIKVTAAADNDARADLFYESIFVDHDTSKGRFAQELAQILEAETLTRADVPGYILEALVYLEVIPNAD
jgi:putative ATP-dependent endonuclease of OLD family